MAWQNFNATDYQDLLAQILLLVANDGANIAAVNAGGTGYTVGDILDVQGGTVVGGFGAQLEVTSVSGGVVDGIRVFNGGAYSAQPTNPVSVTGGTGNDDATFDLTFQSQPWAVNRDQARPAPDASEQEVMLQGVGSGTDEIFVGIRTLSDDIVGYHNWELAGFTGFDSGLIWEDQPGYSGSVTAHESYVPLTDGAIECWLNWTGRRIIGVFRIGTTYNNMYVGFLNPYATPNEYPYPLFIEGCSTRFNELFGTSGLAQSGLVEPLAWTGANASGLGPGIQFFVDGQWYDVQNGEVDGGGRSNANDRLIWPTNFNDNNNVFAEEDQIYDDSASNSFEDVIPHTGTPGSPGTNLLPTPNSGGDFAPLVPTVMTFSTPSLQIIGELDDVFWVPANGFNLTSEDTLRFSGVQYRVFQNCNRTDQFAFLAIKEDFQ